MTTKINLYNTLSRQKEELKPITPGTVKIYNCGPTVYNRMHLGNIRAYAEWDILHRALLFLGYKVERGINFTDVGHMSADEDFGDDKVELQSAKEGKTPKEITDYYMRTVLDDFQKLNYLNPDGTQADPDMDLDDVIKHGWLRATEHIQQMIDFVKQIEANGFTYETDQAVYFDISKYEDYTKLSRQKLEDKLIGVREEVEEDLDKKHPADFVLWMKRVGKYEKHLQHWNSPWGDGFPGWHIECSAMGCDYLGDHFDIHTGGVDHIAVHHTNERAQNFGYFKHNVVTMWMHNEFVKRTDGDKMSKSAGDTLNLEYLAKQGFEPMDLRYQLISVNYRQPMNLSIEVLQAARNARLRIIKKAKYWAKDDSNGVIIDKYIDEFKVALADDLNMSAAMAVVHEMLNDKENSGQDLYATLLKLDEVLGLRIVDETRLTDGGTEMEIPQEVLDLLEKRNTSRDSKEFELADKYRDELAEMGYKVVDEAGGSRVEKV